jgi:diguanylate cyclase (GGDEF)-like protein/PAS domain S-box-containing protein
LRVAGWTDADAVPESDADVRDAARVRNSAASCEHVVENLTEQLVELRRHLDGVLAHTDTLIFAKDLQGRYTLANRAMLEVLGRHEAEVLGRADHELFPAAVAEEFARHDAQVARSGKVTRFEGSVVQPDGSTKTYLSTRFPMGDEAGVIYAVGGVATDITESVRTRRQLAASQQRWRALVDASPASIVVFSARDLRFVYANARAADVFGVTNARDLIGRACSDALPPETRARFRDRVADMLGGESLENTRLEILGFDGRHRTVEVNAGFVVFDDAPAIQVEVRDITAQEAAGEALRISEERFRMLWERSPVGVVESNLKGIALSVNPALCELVGRTAEELLGRSSLELMSTDAAMRVAAGAAALEVLEGRAGQQTFETTYIHSSGRAISVLVTIAMLYTSDGAPCRFVATVLDITARRQAEEDLRASEVLLRTAFDYAPNGMMLMDGDGVLLQTNPALCSLLGRTEDELKVAFEGLELVHPEDRSDLMGAVGDALVSENGTASVDMRLLDKEGRAHWTSVSLALLLGPQGVGNVLVQVQDIAERQAAHERLTHRATHDALTELPNRVLLSQRIKRALDERLHRADNTDVALLFLDLDGFKAINDTHGHQVGDEVLMEVARRLQHAVRPTDLVARLGGDEFVVLCDALPYPEEAVWIAERLGKLIAHPIQSSCGQLQVEVSVGISHAVEDITAQQLLGQADTAMYAEKRHRRRRLRGRVAMPQQRPA